MNVEAKKRIREALNNWLGFVWIALYSRHQKRENRRNRKRESRWFWGGIVLACVFWVQWLRVTFDYEAQRINPASFIFLYVVTAVMMNLMARRRWSTPDYAKFLKSDKRLLHTAAPDFDKGLFPIAWSERHGWLNYGYRTPDWEKHLCAHHIALFGESDQTQMDLVSRCIYFALQNSPIVYKRNRFRRWKKKPVGGGTCDFVVVGFDVDSGGLNFKPFFESHGIKVFDGSVDEVASAINFISGIISDRAKGRDGQRRFGSTQILLVTEGYVTDCVFKKTKNLAHVQNAIENIVHYGKEFGVHVIAAARPETAEEGLRRDVSHYFMPIKFFTRAKYEDIDRGKKISLRSKSPEYFRDVALAYYRGTLNTVKIIFQPPKSIMAGVRNVRLTKSAEALYKALVEQDYPRVRKNYREPKISRWKENAERAQAGEEIESEEIEIGEDRD